MTISDLISELQQWDQSHPNAKAYIEMGSVSSQITRVEYEPTTNTIWIQ